MRFFLFTYFLGFSFCSCAQVSDQYIRWGDKKLSWNDFAGTVIENSEFDALTFSAISLEFQGENITLEFEIESIFDPLQSWKKKGVNAYILKHEQLHFDITEYHSRLLKKKLKSHRFKSFKTVESDVQQLFDDAYVEANAMQDKYDKQTNHSLKTRAQLRWNKKMQRLLRKTMAYKNPRVVINIGYLL